jgi:hypothetical protein
MSAKASEQIHTNLLTLKNPAEYFHSDENLVVIANITP